MASTDWVLIAGGLLAIVVAATYGYYLTMRLRSRRDQALADLANSPVFADDRAHNQIRMARAELQLLEREGRSVPRAAELLDQADGALGRRENVAAVRMARDAHDLLVVARRQGVGGVAGPPSRPPRISGGPSPGADQPPVARQEPSKGAAPATPSDSVEAGATRPPKNRMEAHFQMTLLVDHLQRARELSPVPPGWAEAEGLRNGAQAAYASGDYTEALRLALRGRRKLGAQLETLPPVRTASAPASGAPAPTTASGNALPNPADAPEACPRCGRRMGSDDRFCRGCGFSRGPSTCPRCRAPITSEDTFCGRCGSPLT